MGLWAHQTCNRPPFLLRSTTPRSMFCLSFSNILQVNQNSQAKTIQRSSTSLRDHFMSLCCRFVSLSVTFWRWIRTLVLKDKKKKKDIICNGKNCLNLQTDKKCSFVQPLLNKPPLPKLNQTVTVKLKYFEMRMHTFTPRWGKTWQWHGWLTGILHTLMWYWVEWIY